MGRQALHEQEGGRQDVQQLHVRIQDAQVWRLRIQVLLSRDLTKMTYNPRSFSPFLPPSPLCPMFEGVPCTAKRSKILCARTHTSPQKSLPPLNTDPFNPANHCTDEVMPSNLKEFRSCRFYTKL